MSKKINGPWQLGKDHEGWSVERHANGCDTSQIICDASGKVVAFAVDYSDRPFAELNTDHENLIVESPNLLKALKELIQIVEIHSEATGNNFAWAELDVARSVVAKVEGGAA